MEKITQRIDLSLYFDVIKRLPGIDGEEVKQAEEAFADAFDGEIPEELVFDRGSKSGDGRIYAYQRSADEFGRMQKSKLYLDDLGGLSNPETGFAAEVPFLVARYFMSSLFGKDELSSVKNHFFPARKNFFYYRTIGASNPWGPLEERINVSHYAMKERQQNLERHLPTILNGARLMYECAAEKGSADRCGRSEGAQMIASAYRALEDKAWHEVEGLRRTVGEDGDAIEGLMEAYAQYRSPAGGRASLDRAIENYGKSVDLIREAVEKEEAAFDVFADRNCKYVDTGCWEFPDEEICDDREREVRQYVCDYGIERIQERFAGPNFFD